MTRLFFSKFVAKLVNEAGIFWNLSLQSFFPEGIREMSSALMRRKKAKLKAWDMDVSYIFEEYPEKYSFTGWWLPYYRSTRPEMCCEKNVLRNFAKFTGKHLCQSLFFKKETLAQVFSCEFCEISKNTFSYRTLPVAASNITYWQYFQTPNQSFKISVNQTYCILFASFWFLQKRQNWVQIPCQLFPATNV